MKIAGLNTYIKVGGIEFPRAPGIRIVSERHVPMTRIDIRVPDPTGNVARAISDRDPVAVIMHYRSQPPSLWEGTVKAESVRKNKDQLVIHVKGKERILTETCIKQAFENETPEAVIRYAITQAGLAPGKIESPGVIFPRFIASTIPVWQVAKQCENTCRKAFGLDMRQWALWMGRDGKVNWGPGDEVANIPVIESNANLIEHSPAKDKGALSRIETFMLPGMMHSMKFRIKDLKWGVEGDFRALKVEHVLEDTSARTFISYGEEYERYRS